MKNNEDGIPQAEMTGEDWKAQKLVSAELRRLRELSGMTRKELVEKMGPPYTEERKRRLWRRIDAKNPRLKVSRGTGSE